MTNRRMWGERKKWRHRNPKGAGAKLSGPFAQGELGIMVGVNDTFAQA